MSITLKKEYGDHKIDEKKAGKTMEEMLEENLRLTEEMHGMVKSIKGYVFWARIWGVLKIFIIIIPIVLSIIYLPPLLSEVMGQYQDLLGGGSLDATELLNSLDPSVLTDDLKNLIK